MEEVVVFMIWTNLLCKLTCLCPGSSTGLKLLFLRIMDNIWRKHQIVTDLSTFNVGI